MNTNTLDKTKSYGKVTGHKSAAYEQNGVLYDVNGKPLIEVKPKRKYTKRRS